MRADDENYGQRRFRLGAVELGVVVVGLSLCGWLITQWGTSITQSQGNTTKQVAALTTQVAVMNDQMATLTSQLVNVPENTKAIARLEAQYLDLERRMEVLENQRGVRVKGWTH